MELRRRELFTTIRTEGAILPPDLLQRIAGGDNDLGGLKPADYHLFEGEPLNEAIVRSWNRLVGAWAAFGEARARLPGGDPGTTITRERWLLILFDELGYGRLQPARAVEINGKSYAASHSWGEHVPVHLVGCNVPLDRRSQGVAGAAVMSPHGLIQELLNRSEERLWGFVSNGLALRVLRDNSSLTRQAYVEFDIASTMDGGVYADFVVLWLVCHQSRVEGETPHECWLERWSQEAAVQGTRALEGLRNGVEQAISALGAGFLAHPANNSLRDDLRAGTRDPRDHYRELLRLVYRLLFLFVAEDRGLLLSPDVTRETAARYDTFYSTRRLRRLAERRRGSKHADMYRGLRLIMEKLGDDGGCPELGLPALGSYLWSTDALPDLSVCELSNKALLDAVRALATIEEKGIRRPVDYRNLGAEELGSIYESLLELHPEINADAASFALTTAAGNERKTTGSYYTASSLIGCLLDSALEPVLDEAAAKGEQAILDLRIIDPACGSGHFLVAAAHRVAKRLAAVRTREAESSPEATRTALRDVVGRCLYGVDVNPMAIELCKVSLWMEALEPGKPLSFLDAHVKCGNSLFGTTIALISGGIPDEAYKTAAGDEPGIASAWKRQNQAERGGQLTLTDLEVDLISDLRSATEALESAGDSTVADVHRKERRLAELAASDAHARAKLVADAWCAAFVQRKIPSGPRITTSVVRQITAGQGVSEEIEMNVRKLAHQYGFFHWEIEFPSVFGTETDGFDVVIGNPPWERIKIQEKEFFETRRPDIAAARRTSDRRQMISRLAEEDPALFEEFQDILRQVDGQSSFVRASGRYPLCGRGDINTYALFAEVGWSLVGTSGRLGCILPSGIATDYTTRLFFNAMVEAEAIASVYDFENRKGLFPAVGGNVRFSLITLTRTPAAEFRVGAQMDDPTLVHDTERTYVLTASDVRLMNPNSKTLPAFSSARSAEICKTAYQRVPVLQSDVPGDRDQWRLTLTTLFHMSNDSKLFRAEEDFVIPPARRDGNTFAIGSDTWLPLYEAKLVNQFNHRAATFEGITGSAKFKTHSATTKPDEDQLRDPGFTSTPRFWVGETEVASRIASQQWFLAYRNAISAVADSRSLVATIVPRGGAGNSLLLVIPDRRDPLDAAVLLALFNSFFVDFVVRQKATGGNLTFYILRQLPIPAPSAFTRQGWFGESMAGWLAPRVLELCYTAWDLQSFAEALGWMGAPFCWDSERRAVIRAEIDAAVFHLYGLAEVDVEYVLETFSIVKRRDEEKHGVYRTKDLILDAYRGMRDAMEAGIPYNTALSPPPADPRVAHDPKRTAAIP